MSSELGFAEHLISLARAYLLKEAPYLATTVYGLTSVPTEAIDTLGVTAGLVMYFNPKWIAAEPTFKTRDTNGGLTGYKCMASCLYHECQHIVRGIERLEALPQADLANIAGDMCINDDLKAGGWVLPPWVVYSSSYKFKEGLPLEGYYNLLAKDADKALGKLKKHLSATGGPENGGVMAGTCGGVGGHAANQALEAELDEDDGRPEVEVQRIRETTMQQIKEHIAQNGQGSAPGFYEQDLKFERKVSIVPWPRVLHHVARRTFDRAVSGADDFSLRRPSKRSMVLGVLRAGLIGHELNVAFVRDTSGSMNDNAINHANSEIMAIMKKMGLDSVWLLDADVIVHSCKKVRIRDIPRLKVKGRGGTSFVQAIEAVEAIKPCPSVLIYLTDGGGTAPEKAPKKFSTIWCIVPAPYTMKPAEWGKIVVCSDDPAVRKKFE